MCTSEQDATRRERSTETHTHLHAWNSIKNVSNEVHRQLKLARQNDREKKQHYFVILAFNRKTLSKLLAQKMRWCHIAKRYRRFFYFRRSFEGVGWLAGWLAPPFIFRLLNTHIHTNSALMQPYNIPASQTSSESLYVCLRLYLTFCFNQKKQSHIIH